MSRPKDKTPSSRRHAFKSFRERIESLKIDPSLNLTRKAHEYVETSHFLATLEHWKEVNISGNFSEFVDKVDSISQTLPQIIYHKSDIYQALHTHIERNDAHSIQPLLELLSQFVHDLGEDFLAFYLNTLDLLINLTLNTNPNDAQNDRNSANVLEWSFNCLALIFKYLSRLLAKDLIPTFKALLPLLLLTKKVYISRFCAEALSFLLRKADNESLVRLVEFTFYDNRELFDSNASFRDSVVILFSESVKNTKGSFHSKSSLIISNILRISLSRRPISKRVISIVCDILLDVIKHGTIEHCKRIYNTTNDILKQHLSEGTVEASVLTGICQLLTALLFADSGRKIASWDSTLSNLKLLLRKGLVTSFQYKRDSIIFGDLSSYLISILFRNCDFLELSKCYKVSLDFLLAFEGGAALLSFSEASLELSNEKVVKYGLYKYVQNFIIMHKVDDFELKKLAYFSKKSVDKNSNMLSELHLPDELISHIANSVDKIVSESLDSVLEERGISELHWRILLLKNFNCLDKLSFSTLISLLKLFMKSYKKLQLNLSIEVFSCVLGLTASRGRSTNDSDVFVDETMNIICHSFNDFSKFSSFIFSVRNFVRSNDARVQPLLKEVYRPLIKTVIENLSLNDQVLRYNSIHLVIETLDVLNIEKSATFSQIRLIEEIPLTLSNGRDLELRIRSLAKEFSDADRSDELENLAITRFLFGLLTNNFQPCWKASFESFPKILSKCSNIIWEVACSFLFMNYRSQEESTDDLTMESNCSMYLDLEDWICSDSKLKENCLSLIKNFYIPYHDALNTLSQIILASDHAFKYSYLMRGRVIEALSYVPSVAERHSHTITSLILQSEDEDDQEDYNESSDDVGEKHQNEMWSLKDKNNLLSLLIKFNDLKKINNSDKLYDRILYLLSNKNIQVQKLALDVILNWKIASINKYRDNLKNLLDDSLFKDELAKLVTNDTTSIIEASDKYLVMPIILRILFGRALISHKSKNKAGRKLAVIHMLPNFSDHDIVEFISLGSNRIGYKEYFASGSLDHLNSRTARKLNGFVNLLGDILGTLGSQFTKVLETTIHPLIYTLIASQSLIRCGANQREEENVMKKSVKTTRQQGMKCLNELFELLGASFDWSPYSGDIYVRIVKPRLSNFVEENLQQTSSLLKIMISWINIPRASEFLYMDDFFPVKSIMSLLDSSNVKDEVVSSVLDFSITALQRKSFEDERYFTLLAMTVNNLLQFLPEVLIKARSSEINFKAVRISQMLTEGNYITDYDTRSSMIRSLTEVLDNLHDLIVSSDMSVILSSLKSLVKDHECSLEETLPLFHVCSKLLRTTSSKATRLLIISVFESFASRFETVKDIFHILEGINAYSTSRLEEPDYEQRIMAFRSINEELYASLSPNQWFPLINCALYFIANENEPVFKANSTFMLKRFVDCYSLKDKQEDSVEYIHMLKETILVHLRIGIRRGTEATQSEFIALLEHIVSKSKFYDVFNDMKALLFGGDEEANFFKNINHIQLHRRQRAMKRVAELKAQLSENSIAHYILPIMEKYALSNDETLRNLSNEALETIGQLVECVSWKQYLALFRRYISNLKKSNELHLKSNVNLVVSVSKALYASFHFANRDERTSLKLMPSNRESVDNILVHEFLPTILKILLARNDETIVSRIPLSEGLVYLIMCLSENLIASELPGVLTSTCQVLRSRSEELRDATRKSMGRISNILGSEYLSFIIKELKSSLSRGSQIHVLSYTLHSLLLGMSEKLQHGDLDDCVSLSVEIIMEDIFGAAGQEKDADGYHSKMKEVKFKKSYDCAEILSSNISFSSFSFMLNPIDLLLRENISLKTQNKLDELLKRYALGINHNSESSDKNLLHLCFEIHKLSEITSFDEKKQLKPSEEHFLVILDSKPQKLQNNSIHDFTFKKFAFELLRTALTRHASLLSASNMRGFLPQLESGINSENEGVVISSLRVLILVTKLRFDDRDDYVFKTAAKKCLNIIKSCPNTNSEIAQACLKYLASVIKQNPEVSLKETSISYILIRIQPDLEEPNRQGLAFSFLKAIVSRHIMIPEVYDIMDKVSKIMITNHSKEIRDMSRSIYFQFLMEYDQGRGRLEKQFKFLVNNLSYATQSGRQSVMELIHLVIVKSGTDLLQKLSTSFFVALANVSVGDDSSKCREMASESIRNMMIKLGLSNISNIVKYCHAWLDHPTNKLLKRCGLSIYKIYIGEFEVGAIDELDKSALDNITDVLLASKHDSYSDDIVDWELVYTSLSVFSAICGKLRASVFQSKFMHLWKATIENLLYPHSWVRLMSCRLIEILITNFEAIEFELSEYEIQTIAYRLFRQLGAPSISVSLASQITKNLTLIAVRWEKLASPYQDKENGSEVDSNEAEPKFTTANDFMLYKCTSLIRQEGQTSLVSKKSAIQLAAMLIQVLSDSKLSLVSEAVLLALYPFLEVDGTRREEVELIELSQECAQIIEGKLGISEYSRVIGKVQKLVFERRQERKLYRAKMSITAPEIAARRKLKKHARSREKRKHEKDENGFYHQKRKRHG